MPANLENLTVVTELEKVSVHSNPKEEQCQRRFKLLYLCTKLLQSCPTLCDPIDPLSMGFSRQEYTKGLYKKDLQGPDNHEGVITHLEPDILECKVTWALGSITINKASGGDGIPVELFQILER